VESNKETVAQVVQWSNVALDIWDRIKVRKQQAVKEKESIEPKERTNRSRMYV
jgi:hypothetical protein